MSDNVINAPERFMREIRSELADMRDDRTVMISMLERHDASISGIGAEQRALRSQFDRFRTEVRSELAEQRALLVEVRTLLVEALARPDALKETPR